MDLEREPVRMILVRHGEQERDGDDGPLSARGVAQAVATAEALGLTDDDRLVSSTLRRAVQTATALGRDPEQFADLDEFRFGQAWTWDQAEVREDLALWRPDDKFDDENLRQFQARVEGAVSGLLTPRPVGRLVIVAHSGVIDAILRWVFGATPDTAWTTEVTAAHASLSEVHHWPDGRHEGGAPRHSFVVRLGDVAHLPSALVTGH